MSDSLAGIEGEVIDCRRCRRLRDHCRRVAREKRASYRGQEYWGRPVSSFGDPEARILLVGLAPGAHGANRTGRMFTGDDSGDFLFASLHRAGLASQAESSGRSDGLLLRDTYITAAARCAPPGNRPLPGELAACRPYLVRELAVLKRVRVIVALGGIAFAAVRATLEESGFRWPRPVPRFGHGVVVPSAAGRPVVIASYHPSRQNTRTGRLRPAMLLSVLREARRVGRHRS